MAKTEDKKLFFDLRELTELFKGRIQSNQDLNIDCHAKFQSIFMLAIAQQLSVVSSHLRELLDAVHRSEGKK
jgi:hypothetical protein